MSLTKVSKINVIKLFSFFAAQYQMIHGLVLVRSPVVGNPCIRHRLIEFLLLTLAGASRLPLTSSSITNHLDKIKYIKIKYGFTPLMCFVLAGEKRARPPFI